MTFLSFQNEIVSIFTQISLNSKKFRRFQSTNVTFLFKNALNIIKWLPSYFCIYICERPSNSRVKSGDFWKLCIFWQLLLFSLPEMALVILWAKSDFGPFRNSLVCDGRSRLALPVAPRNNYFPFCFVRCNWQKGLAGRRRGASKLLVGRSTGNSTSDMSVMST